MTSSIPLTINEEDRWNDLQPFFKQSNGDTNPDFVRLYAEKIPERVIKKIDYDSQVKDLVIFLKQFPEYLDTGLLPLYKFGRSMESVHQLIETMKTSHPQELKNVLLPLFASERAMGMQVTLLMDLNPLLDPNEFTSLNFSHLLKNDATKLIKAFTPNQTNAPLFMNLASGLSKNSTTKNISESIACSVAIQLALSNAKANKRPGIEQYEWINALLLWKEYDWQWDIEKTIRAIKTRSKGSTVISDMVTTVADPQNPYPEKIEPLFQWLMSSDSQLDLNDKTYIDRSVANTLATSKNQILVDQCVQWINHRSYRYTAWDSVARRPQRLVNECTVSMIQDFIVPKNITKADALLALFDPKSFEKFTDNKEVLVKHTEVFKLIKSSDIPLGDIDLTLGHLVNKWVEDLGVLKSNHGYDHTPHMIKSQLSELCSNLEPDMKAAIQQSDNFKKLLLLAAYKSSNTTSYDNSLIPDLTAMPFAALTLTYPEHQDEFTKLHAKILDKKFAAKDGFQMIAKVLFDLDLPMDQAIATAESLGCPIYEYLRMLNPTRQELIIPESFDFNMP